MTKKNGGNPPSFPLVDGKPDRRMEYAPIMCNVCSECVRKKSREWSVRLEEEVKDKGVPKVVTLTYDEPSLKELKLKVIENSGGVIPEEDDLLNYVASESVKMFLNRWVKKHGKSLRHWLVTERGSEKGRIHMHGLFWTEESDEELQERWKYGNVDMMKYLGEKTTNYFVKYLFKVNKNYPIFKGKVLASKGIGRYYVDKNKGLHKYREDNTRTYYKKKRGQEVGLPEYYRRLLWTEEERALLWTKLLDEDKRYIAGIEIKEEDNEDAIYKRAREKDVRLGFKRVGWDRKAYYKARYNVEAKKRIEERRRRKSVVVDEVVG